MRTGGSVVAALVVAAVTVAVVSMTPAIESDTTWAILAVEQRIAGRGNTLQQVYVADPEDLSRDQIQPIGWSAPGQQDAVYLLRRSGLSLGSALKTVIAGSWLVGVVAWSVYFQTVAGASAVVPWLVAAFALFRMSHYHAYTYFGGDQLLWAVFPIALLVNLRAIASARAGASAVLAGALAGGLVLLKYSAVFLSVAIGLTWVVAALRREVSPRRTMLWGAGAALGTSAALAAGVGSAASVTTPATSMCSAPLGPVLVWGGGGWLMGISDITALADSFLRRTGRGGATETVVGGLTVGLMLLVGVWLLASWRVVRPRFAGATVAGRVALRMVILTIATVSMGLIVLMLRGGCVSMESRHQQYGAYALLPFLAVWLVEAFEAGSRGVRAISAVTMAVLIAVPAAYGASALVDKALIRMPANRANVVPSGFRVDWLGAAAPGIARELETRSQTRDMLLAVTSPDLGIVAPQARILILPGGVAPLPWLQAASAIRPLHGRPAGPVLLVAQPDSRIARAIVAQRHAFVDIRSWSPLRLGQQIAAWVGR